MTTDTTPAAMPARIWVFEDEPGGVPLCGFWIDEQSECPEGSPEYIRADVAASAVLPFIDDAKQAAAERDALRAELAALQARVAESYARGMNDAANIAESPSTKIFKRGWGTAEDAAAISAAVSVASAIRAALAKDTP
jgi:hypothetical protein